MPKAVITSLIIFLSTFLYGQATSEELDPFYREVDDMIHHLDPRNKEIMTVKVIHYEEGNEYPFLREKMAFRFINDSVFEQRFYDRMVGRRIFFVVRGKKTFEYDKKHGHAINGEISTIKDSAGYTIRIQKIKSREGVITYYQRSNSDSSGHFVRTLSYASNFPGVENEFDNYSDTLMIYKHYKTADGYRRLVSKMEHQHKVIRNFEVEDVYTTTRYDSDKNEPEVSTTKIIIQLQYDADQKLTYADRTEYVDGIQLPGGTVLEVNYEK